MNRVKSTVGYKRCGIGDGSKKRFVKGTGVEIIKGYGIL